MTDSAQLSLLEYRSLAGRLGEVDEVEESRPDLKAIA